nr:hypothetical protein [Elizabethkingia sp. ASV34]
MCIRDSIDIRENRESYFATPKKLDELVLIFNRGGKNITTKAVSYTHLTLPTTVALCRSRGSRDQ